MRKLVFVLLSAFICLPTFANTFSSRGHYKSNGINIEISYPAGWSAAEGKRPHVVQVFRNGYSQCSLTIVSVEQKLSRKEWQSEFKAMTELDYRDIAEELGNLVSYKKTEYEGYPGVLIESVGKKSRSGVDAYFRGLTHMFGYSDSMIFLQCFSFGSTQKAANAEFAHKISDFMNFGNNIIIPDKYDNSLYVGGKKTKIVAEHQRSESVLVLFCVLIVALFLLPKVIKNCAEKVANKLDNFVSKNKDRKNDK